MPRARRIHYEGAVYHVTSRGNERRKIVTNDDDRWMFVRFLAEMIEENDVVCHAWVLMDNHYHLLLEVPESNLSQAMKHLNALYTQKFNKRHHRVGHLFQGRYKSIAVEKETYLKELCRYLVLNPVRARMVKHAKDWKWSSYRATAGLEKPESWLSVDWVLGRFGKDRGMAQKGYMAFVSDGMGQKGSPWEDLFSQVYLGSDKFLDHVHEVGQKHKHLDIPKYQKHVAKLSPEAMVAKAAKMYKEKPEEILQAGRRGSEARSVAIYLLKKRSGMSSREIGLKMGIGTSAVGNQWLKMKKRVIEDKKLAKKLEKC